MRNAPLILPAALVLAACATAPEMTTGTTVVNVTASYRERIMLPPGHVLTVKVEDVSLADAPAQVLAEASEPLTVAIRSTRSATEVTIAENAPAAAFRSALCGTSECDVRSPADARSAASRSADNPESTRRAVRTASIDARAPAQATARMAGPLYPRCTATAATAIVAIRSPCDRVARRVRTPWGRCISGP